VLPCCQSAVASARAVSCHICVNYLNLVINSLNQEVVQCRGNAMTGVNSITAKNNTIITLHVDDEKCGSKRLAPTVSSMEMTPLASIELPTTPLSVWLVFISSSSSRPSFLKMEYDIKLMAVPPSMSNRRSASRRCDLERIMALCVGSTSRVSQTRPP
jgi:hypothetical protein